VQKNNVTYALTFYLYKTLRSETEALFVCFSISLNLFLIICFWCFPTNPAESVATVGVMIFLQKGKYRNSSLF
jgi:hypothetical protein